MRADRGVGYPPSGVDLRSPEHPTTNIQQPTPKKEALEAVISYIGITYKIVSEFSNLVVGSRMLGVEIV